MKALLLILCISASFTWAQEHHGSGALLVIPEGHRNPVPYETLLAVKKAKYRNFFNLPCVNGNREPRRHFDRDYACHAMEWLNEVKDIVPSLYERLVDVARKTHFEMINDFIKWEHIPYPDGELDYKKYEKAAYFKDSVILSTKVMDRVGPLADVLTAEENQGYILFHELINALLPNETVKYKLDLGEVFIQKKIFKLSKVETIIRLMLLDISFVKDIEDFDLREDILDEFIKINPHHSGMNFLKYELWKIRNIYRTGKTFSDVYVDYLEKNPPKNTMDLIAAIRDSGVGYATELRFENPIDMIQTISAKSNISEGNVFVALRAYFNSESVREIQKHADAKLLSLIQKTPNMLKRSIRGNIDLAKLEIANSFILNKLKNQSSSYKNNFGWNYGGFLIEHLELSEFYDLILFHTDRFSRPNVKTEFKNFMERNSEKLGVVFEKSMRVICDELSIDFDRSYEYQQYLELREWRDGFRNIPLNVGDRIVGGEYIGNWGLEIRKVRNDKIKVRNTLDGGKRTLYSLDSFRGSPRSYMVFKKEQK